MPGSPPGASAARSRRSAGTARPAWSRAPRPTAGRPASRSTGPPSPRRPPRSGAASAPGRPPRSGSASTPGRPRGRRARRRGRRSARPGRAAPRPPGRTSRSRADRTTDAQLRKGDQAGVTWPWHHRDMITADRLQWLLGLVEESLAEPELTGEQLARRAHLSRFHFDRLVAAALGESPALLRRRLLLERAAYRLRPGHDRITDLAPEAGYGSPEAFTRAFARAFGRSPTAYRRRPAGSYRLPARSGVHFHPPGGLRLPPTTRSATMDVLDRMIDHHLWL